jgi:hypothetical protein
LRALSIVAGERFYRDPGQMERYQGISRLDQRLERPNRRTVEAAAAPLDYVVVLMSAMPDGGAAMACEGVLSRPHSPTSEDSPR